MKKKSLVPLIGAAVILILLVSQVAAAVYSTGDSVLDGLYEEMLQVRTQIVERRVELGEFSPEQGEAIIERFENNYRDRTERWEEEGYEQRGRGAGWRFFGRPGHCGGFGWRW